MLQKLKLQKLKLGVCLAAALATSACSTRPRNFSAEVKPISTGENRAHDEAADFTTCNQLVRSGRSSGFMAAAVTGAAGGAGALGGAVASLGVSSSLSTAGAAASVAMPIIGLAAAFGVNRMIRAGKERKYKRTMTDCMREFGYEVGVWTKAPRKQQGTAIKHDPVAETAPSPPPGPAENPAPAASVAAAD